MRARGKRSPQAALNMGTFGAAGIADALMYPVAALVMGSNTFDGGRGALNIALASIFGLVA